MGQGDSEDDCQYQEDGCEYKRGTLKDRENQRALSSLSSVLDDGWYWWWGVGVWCHGVGPVGE